MRLLATLAVAALLGGCAESKTYSDWEQQNVRTEVGDEALPELPAFPRRDTLIEFPVSAVPNIRFFIDGATLGVESGVVRYVLVARSASGGAENVSYEGLRCRTAEHRRYAVGRSDGTWVKPSANGWRPHAAWHKELQREYFCPQMQAIRDPGEGVRALRDGANSFSRGLGQGVPLGM